MGVQPKGLTVPELMPGSEKFMNGFALLNQARSVGDSGHQPISVSEVAAYLWVSGETDPDEKLRFAKVIRALDNVMLEHISKQK